MAPSAGQAQRALRHRGLEGSLPTEPCRRPVPGADRHDSLATDTGRGDRCRERAAVRAISDHGAPRSGEAIRHRTADPVGRLLSLEGPSPAPERSRAPRALSGGGAAGVLGADEPARGGAQDGELRPRLWLRNPGDPGRHPRAPHRKPARDRPDPKARGDGGGAPSIGPRAVLDPAQSPPRAAWAEPLPADRAPVRHLPDRVVVRYGSGSDRRTGPAGSGQSR